jgi:transcriptional regulator with PAS, ATPase and Fis domain
VRRSFKAIGKEANGLSTETIEDDEVILPLSEIERRHILRVLSRTGGNKQAAARILGIDRTTLQRKLERYDLEAANGGTTNGS